VATGEADAVIGGDVVVTASSEALTKMQEGRTRVVVSCAETPTADFTRNPDWQFPLEQMKTALADAVGAEAVHSLDAPRLALRLLGDAIYANLFLLGYSWQLGLVPVSLAAIDRAIELNGAAVATNRKAFLWGRRAAHEPASIEGFLAPAKAVPAPTLDAAIATRSAALGAYQDTGYAARYQALVARVHAAEAPLQSTALTEAVARYYFKLLAIKDEYEVARLYTETDFLDRVRDSFEGDYRLHFHLAPPLFAKPDPVTGRIRKRQYGQWMLHAFAWLARARGLRGTRWDIFGYLPERRRERRLIAEYENDIGAILAVLTPATLAPAVELATLPEKIRGFGHVKARSLEEADKLREELRNRLGIATSTR